MCGIAGYYSSDPFFSLEELHKMTNALSHRGPDANGFFSDHLVGLGHRRLSVIDLTAFANQPMTSACGRYVMVYNGEVYNYQEIGERLIQNHQLVFQTKSDSEIILEAFVHYGTQFVDQLNGMFAISIYDKKKEELFIFRDRMGIKPLYYFWDGSHFAFSSELKSLVNCKKIPLNINSNAVSQFLHMGFIPAPLSIYESVKKLESGTFLHLAGNKLSTKSYWSIKQQVSKKVLTDEKTAISTLDDLLSSSIQYQLKSDVPFGVFLSGGIDSSLITAKAVEVSPSQINTFSIGFEENKYNESRHARAVANHLKTNHHEFIVSHKDALDLIEKSAEVYSEPFSDSSFIPTMLVSKLAKKHVTVALSGEGGDELFLGYGAHQWAKRLDHFFIKPLRLPIAKALSITGYERHSAHFKYPSKELKYSHILSQEQNCFSLSEIEILLKGKNVGKKVSTETDPLIFFGKDIEAYPRKLSAMEKQAVFDLNFYLQDDLLCKVDRASMHYSLETRVPLLDHRIVEFALNLAPDLKCKEGTNKYLLKQLLYKQVPKKLIDRPKQGFSIPLENWLQHELRFLIEENLSNEIIQHYNLVNYKEVESLKKRFFDGSSHLYNRIWLLIILHQWLKKNT